MRRDRCPAWTYAFYGRFAFQEPEREHDDQHIGNGRFGALT